MKIIFLILLIFCTPFFIPEVYTQQVFSIEDTTLAAQYSLTGESLQKTAKYDSSTICFKKAEEIYDFVWKQTSDDELCRKMLTCDNQIGWNYMMQAKYEAALELLDRALQTGLNELGENDIGVAQTYLVLGVVYWAKEDYFVSIKYHEKALAIKLAVLGPENIGISSSYTNLGIDYDEIGDYDKALEYYQKDLEIQLKASEVNEASLAKTYNNIGNVYLDKEDFDKALEFHQKALTIRKRVLNENNPYTASSYDNIGIVYAQEEEYAKALDFFKKALSIRIKAFGESHPSVSSTLNRLGNSYYYLHDYDTALEYCQKSLNLERAFPAGQHHSLLNIYTNLGKIYKDKGDLDSAINYFDKVIELGTTLYGEKNLYNGVGYKRLAEVYFKKLEYAKALSYCQKGLISLVHTFINDSVYSNPELSGIISETELLNILSLKASILSRMSVQTGNTDLVMSLSTYRLICNLIELMRTGYRAEGTKIFLGEKTNKIFDQAIQVSLQLYESTKDDQYKNLAFYFAGKSKAAVLQENFSEVNAKRFSGIPDSLLQQEKQLRTNLTFYETALQKKYERRDPGDSSKIVQYENSVFDLKNEYDQLISGFEQNYPEYYNLRFQTKSFSAGEIQNILTENTALLDYFVGDSLIYIFEITRNDFNIFYEKKGNQFSGLVKDFYSSIVKAETRNYFNSSNELSSILISPVLAKIRDKEKLVIIPEGELFKIPFGALFTEKSKPDRKDFSKLKYLIKSFDISYHYSTSLYISSLNSHRTSEGKRDAEKMFIGFAPVFSKTDSDDREQNIMLASASADDSVNTYHSEPAEREKINELKYSQAEVKNIAALFSKSKDKIADRTYYHLDATEDIFKRKIKDYRIIHIATHSFINESHPELSSVLFARPGNSSDAEDGILYAGETYNLDLNADLVVLSSCESGLGKLIRGEGMMSLTRGFLYSGAANIIFSLWKIPDKQTSELMINFYREMLSGRDYGKALRNAKLKIIANPITARPRTWASFIMIGTD